VVYVSTSKKPKGIFDGQEFEKTLQAGLTAATRGKG